MHICYLCDEYPPGPHGGIGTLTQTLARAMAGRGHRVTVVGIYRVPELTMSVDEGVQVIRIPHASLPWTGFLVNGARLRRTLDQVHRATPIDIIEGPELSLALLPRRRSMATVIRMSGGHHFFSVTLGRPPRAWRSWLEIRSFRRADHLCAVSAFVARTTSNLLHLHGRPIEVLPNPVNVCQFKPSTVPSQPGRIVFIGTLTEKKGVRQLIEAFPKIQGAVPHAHLLLVGRDSQDPASGLSVAEDLRRRLPPEAAKGVRFLGHLDRPEVATVLAGGDVAVFPSHMESQGLVILEAMACGKAVVASRIGPGPEIIEHGVSGLLCDPRDPASIAQMVVMLLRDPRLRQRLGEAARDRVVATFSEEALLERTEAFYLRCARVPETRMSRLRVALGR